jgi:hypothetical protein
MRHSIAHLARALLVIGIVGLGVGQRQALAGSDGSRQLHAVGAAQSTDVLIWQGKVLPIVTDVFASISSLGTALQNRDVDGVAKVGDQFAGEEIRFQAVSPVPKESKQTALNFNKALRDMSDGTKALVVGLRASNNADAQRAATKLVNGLREFQQAVDQVRRNSGPIGEPTVVPQANAGPAPTPIIKGIS